MRRRAIPDEGSDQNEGSGQAEASEQDATLLASRSPALELTASVSGSGSVSSISDSRSFDDTFSEKREKRGDTSEEAFEEEPTSEALVWFSKPGVGKRLSSREAVRRACWSWPSLVAEELLACILAAEHLEGPCLDCVCRL